MADDVSLDRAFAEVSKPSGLAASTIKAAKHLLRQGAPSLLRYWLDRHSVPEREAILQLLEQRRKAAQ